MENDRFYNEGEKLPSDDTRPCEVCYCIKGARKCTIKKCAPVIRGCIPKIHNEGSCCPTSYDCRRSIKYKRESRQNDNEDEDEDSDSIDFFSLLFGSDDPKENEEATEVAVSTLPPFKSLPSSAPTTESSFFDLIRAGLEIIDANADKIAPQLGTDIISSTTVATTTSTTAQDSVVGSTESKQVEFNYSKESTTASSLPLTSPTTTMSTVMVNDVKSTVMKTFDERTSTEASKSETFTSSVVNGTKTTETLPLTSTTLSIKSTSDDNVGSSKVSTAERTTSSSATMKSTSPGKGY